MLSWAQISLNAGAGSSVSYVQSRHIRSSYHPIIVPNAIVYLEAPIAKRFSIQSGIGYSFRGYNTTEGEDYGDTKYSYDTKTRLQYLSMPLMLSFKAMEWGKSKLWIDGGMNYSIFVGGKTVHDYSNYKGDVLVERTTITYRVKGRIAPSKYGPAIDVYDVDALDVACKFQLRYIWKDRYTVSVYHEHSLYDMRVKTDEAGPSTLRMRNTGIGVAYRLF